MTMLDLAVIGRELAAGTALPARLRDDGSLPLLLCLRAAALAQVRRSGEKPVDRRCR
ncbi:hypothetical protein [Amycolatopsis saalfeldensis]|uniref:hypothetical protein n=1 Tax=Amycolatopsis saalfeldensis TaxID=394193 RepID=UPI001FE82ADF|nr:hypothetical protein [Amycolatopsis saalfeldensis]